jgi:hypothetical protein
MNSSSWTAKNSLHSHSPLSQSQRYFTTGGFRQSVHLGVNPLETHNQRFFFHLNPCGNSPYVTSSLTRC